MDVGKIVANAFVAAVEELAEKYVGFKKLKKQIKGARDPAAVAAKIAFKKYGKKAVLKAAGKGKKMRGMSTRPKKRKLRLKKAA